MKIVNIILLLFVFIKCYTQCINYSYDPAGNRVSRNICPQPLVIPGGISITKNILEHLSHEISDLKVFPNPGRDFIEIRSSQFSGNSKVQIINILGQKMYEGILNDYRVNMAGWQSGRYFLRLHEGDNVKIVAILKE